MTTLPVFPLWFVCVGTVYSMIDGLFRSTFFRLTRLQTWQQVIWPLLFYFALKLIFNVSINPTSQPLIYSLYLTVLLLFY